MLTFSISISRTQARALAALIQHQLAAFSEACEASGACGLIENGPRQNERPFTAADLEIIEPILQILAEL